ncbi:actin cytoskeleton-regulatory complex protein PAN1-like isoform X2 [Hordeum vulgare subsp. vulgare]|uniref:PWWP domain-containing protein n=1 Tax=Hordeum vulgare subsp. vulgare TaxID=112509 RepID=A0A8I6X318_HORVV|nr:actin cytoskeleton-regulatory complex protein PAN1-like isoform X2 [Hordeum vulgare subsp. vulgare]
MMPLGRCPTPTRPEIPKFPQPPKPKQRNPKPKRKPKPGDLAPKSRVSLPLRRMAGPAAAGSGAVVPAGDSEGWTPRFGDMVWGKVKSHPWWPGHVYSLTLSDDPEVHRGYRHGLVLVAFFGDGSYGWFEPHELVRFEDHFTEKTSQGGSRTFPAAVAESLDEISRRSALALLCPCRVPDTFRSHNEDPRFLLVNVPGFDSNAEYLPDQVTAARERFVPQKMFDFLQNAAVQQRDAAETAARTLPGIEMTAMLMAYRRSRYERYDLTYAESFGVDSKKALEGEVKAENERSQRARPLKGRQKVPEKENAPARGRRGAAGAAARLMEKIMPGAPAMKPKASKKDQYLLKRREDARAPALPPAALPDAAPAPDDGGPPPGFPPAEPQTPPLPSSTGGGDEEEFMLQRRALPPADQASDGGATADAAAAATAPKKVAKPKKARKREREEPAEDVADADAEPKKKKKKKKLAELNGGVPSAAPSGEGGGATKPAALSPPKVDLDGLDLKQSYENDPPEDSKKSLDNKPNVVVAAAAAAAAAVSDGQSPKPLKKKPVMRPSDPTSAGVKRPPSDRQEEIASKKKIKLDKIKTLAADKKAGLEQKVAAATATATASAGGSTAAAQLPRAGMKEKALAAAKKKVPAAAPVKRTPSPTALMMKFPVKSTLPSVASLKARFARFGPLDIDGIRVYWKSHMCRVIYKFQSDAEAALKYAKANAMFGQLAPNYYLRGVEGGSAGADPGPEAPPPQRSDLRLMETTPFRPGSSGNGAPLTLSKAAPARMAVGQPKSILKKSNDEGGLAAASALRDSPRVKFVLDGGDSMAEPPPLPAGFEANNGPDTAAPVSKTARSLGFAPSPLQPPARPAQPNPQPLMRPQHQQLQPPRAPDSQPLPPPPPLPYQPRINETSPYLPRINEPSPYQPRVNEPSYQPRPPSYNMQHPYQPRQSDAPPSFNMQPPYQPRHSDGPLALPGQPPLPAYPPRPGFPGQQYSSRSDDMPPAHFDNNTMPVWKRGEKEFNEELMRVMLGIAKLVEPLMDKNGNFPFHLFSRSA